MIFMFLLLPLLGCLAKENFTLLFYLKCLAIEVLVIIIIIMTAFGMKCEMHDGGHHA
jgi:hypothetical protein